MVKNIYKRPRENDVLQSGETLFLLKREEFLKFFSRIIFARHGETQLNKERRIQGSVDEPLSDEGAQKLRQQILDLQLSSLPINAIISSPMKRAIQSANIYQEIINPHLGITVVDVLREFSHGSWEGKSVSEVLSDPQNELWTRTRASFEKEHGASPHQGEPFFSFLQRVQKALEEILNLLELNFGQGKVLCVSHAEVTRAIRFLYILSDKTKRSEVTLDDVKGYENIFSFSALSPDEFLKVPHGVFCINPSNYELETFSFVR